MNILLINPSLLRETIGHYSKGVERSRGIYPSLGLLYIASALESKKHRVKVIEYDLERAPEEVFESALRSFKPEVVGIYTMTWTFRQSCAMVKKVRELLPSAKTIAGGPQVASFPFLSVHYGEFDYAVVGEGEETIVELIEAIEEGNDVRTVRGIVFKDQGRVVHTAQRPYLEDINRIPFPARHLVPMDHFRDVFTREEKFATMMGSRGCPFDCIYCDRENRMGRRWRPRDPSNMVEEIEEVKRKFGIREFMFFDDEFIIDKKRIAEFCEELLKRGLDVVWECRARVDMVDRELLKIMKRAGCYRIRFGFESGDNRILAILKKGIRVEQSIETARLTKEVGIEVFGYFMMGSPEETPETLQKTLKLALQLDPDFAIFSKTILIAGSELFEWGVEHGFIAADYWERFLRGEEHDPAPCISTRELPGEVVERAIAEANRAFYLRSRYILKRLARIRSFKQLQSHVSMARGMFLQ